MLFSLKVLKDWTRCPRVCRDVLDTHLSGVHVQFDHLRYCAARVIAAGCPGQVSSPPGAAQAADDAARVVAHPVASGQGGGTPSPWRIVRNHKEHFSLSRRADGCTEWHCSASGRVASFRTIEGARRVLKRLHAEAESEVPRFLRVAL